MLATWIIYDLYFKKAFLRRGYGFTRARYRPIDCVGYSFCPTLSQARTVHDGVHHRYPYPVRVFYPPYRGSVNLTDRTIAPSLLVRRIHFFDGSRRGIARKIPLANLKSPLACTTLAKGIFFIYTILAKIPSIRACCEGYIVIFNFES